MVAKQGNSYPQKDSTMDVKEKKMKSSKIGNKGFTLVELIIVIAIIAVLAAVLAPRYLQYVERSREANDIQVATSIMRATTAAMNDPQNMVPPGTSVVVTWYTATENPGTLNGYGSEQGAVGLATDAGLTHTLGSNGYTGGQIQQRFRFDICQIMGLIPEAHSNPSFGPADGFDATGVLGESAVANTVDFSFRINTTTGEISEIPQEWLDLGIKG